LHNQAERAGCAFAEAEVVDLDRHPDSGLVVKTGRIRQVGSQSGPRDRGDSRNNGVLLEIDVATAEENGAVFLETDGNGRTSYDGLYAAGRLAGKELQAVITAGHGAEVATTIVDDAGVPLAHDWIASAGHFADRGAEIPPGRGRSPRSNGPSGGSDRWNCYASTSFRTPADRPDVVGWGVSPFVRLRRIRVPER